MGSPIASLVHDAADDEPCRGKQSAERHIPGTKTNMAHTKVDVPGPELAPEPVPAQQNEGDSSPSGSGKDNTPTVRPHVGLCTVLPLTRPLGQDDAHEKLGRVPLRVGRLKIKGNTYTRSGFILNELNPLRQAGTFAELQREIVNVTEVRVSRAQHSSALALTRAFFKGTAQSGYLQFH